MKPLDKILLSHRYDIKMIVCNHTESKSFSKALLVFNTVSRSIHTNIYLNIVNHLKVLKLPKKDFQNLSELYHEFINNQ